MEFTVCDKLQSNVDAVVIPAISAINADVAETAAGTAAHGAFHALGCGFLAGIQYAVTVYETDRAVNDEISMRSLLLDVMELAVNTKGR